MIKNWKTLWKGKAVISVAVEVLWVSAFFYLHFCCFWSNIDLCSVTQHENFSGLQLNAKVGTPPPRLSFSFPVSPLLPSSFLYGLLRMWCTWFHVFIARESSCLRFLLFPFWYSPGTLLIIVYVLTNSVYLGSAFLFGTLTAMSTWQSPFHPARPVWLWFSHTHSSPSIPKQKAFLLLGRGSVLSSLMALT